MCMALVAYCCPHWPWQAVRHPRPGQRFLQVTEFQLLFRALASDCHSINRESRFTVSMEQKGVILHGDAKEAHYSHSWSWKHFLECSASPTAKSQSIWTFYSRGRAAQSLYLVNCAWHSGIFLMWQPVYSACFQLNPSSPSVLAPVGSCFICSQFGNL